MSLPCARGTILLQGAHTYNHALRVNFTLIRSTAWKLWKTVTNGGDVLFKIM